MSAGLHWPRGHAFIYIGILSVAVIAAQPAAARGLFEALFGPRPVYHVPPPQFYALPGEERSRHHYTSRPRNLRVDRIGRTQPTTTIRRVPLEVSGRPVKPSFSSAKLTAAEERSPVAKFLRDQTLRSGDVVVTDKGAYVFQGSGMSRHRVSDFHPAQNARNLDKAMRTKVSEIARANRWAANSQLSFESTPVNPSRQDASPSSRETSAGSVVAQDMTLPTR